MILGILFEAVVRLVTTTDETSGAQFLQVCRSSGIFYFFKLKLKNK